MTTTVTDTRPTRVAADGGRRTHLARTAGLLYVTIVVLGLFAEVVVRSRLIEADDPAATAANIVADAWLFRAGFAADVVVFVADVALAVVLYRLLRPFGETLALLTAAFRLTQTAVISLNLLDMFDALRILDDATYLGDAVGATQLEAMALSSLDTHAYGYVLGLVFFGVATVIAGRLLWNSRRAPRPLAVLLAVAGVGYVTDAALFFMVPGYDGSVSPVVLAPAVIAEAWFAIWLLTGGRRLEDVGSTPVPPRLARLGASARV